MKFELATVLAVLQVASTHTLFTTLFVNDINQGDGTCIRMPMTPANATFPVTGGSQSTNMACGNGGDMEVSRVCKAPNGAKLTFLFRETPNGLTPGALDPSHKGPCAVYMKYMGDPWTIKAEGSSWFKIWDEGYDSAASKWCTEKLMDNAGLLSITIPGSLPGGYYLVRTELLSLQQSDKSPPDPQFYVGCAQIFLGAPTNGPTGGWLPQAMVSIPGYLDSNGPSLLFNIYTPTWPYLMPGPVPYVQGGLPAKNNDNDTLTCVSDNAVITNANWWAAELASYTDEAGCWNASKSCFDQLTSCYNTAPPTGNRGCKIWEGRCDDIQAGCNASIFTGPSNPGKNLTPLDLSAYNIPAASGLVSGQVYAGSYIDATFGNASSSSSQSTIIPSSTGGNVVSTTSSSPQSTVSPSTTPPSSTARTASQKVSASSRSSISSSVLSLSPTESITSSTTGFTRSTSFGPASTTIPLTTTGLSLIPVNGGSLPKSTSVASGNNSTIGKASDSTSFSTSSQINTFPTSISTSSLVLPTTYSLNTTSSSLSAMQPLSTTFSILPTTHPLSTTTEVSSSATLVSSPTIVKQSTLSNPAPTVASLTATVQSPISPAWVPSSSFSTTARQSTSSSLASGVPSITTTVQTSSSVSQVPVSSSSSIATPSTSSGSTSAIPSPATTVQTSSSVSQVPVSSSSSIAKQSTSSSSTSAIPSSTTTVQTSSSVSQVLVSSSSSIAMPSTSSGSTSAIPLPTTIAHSSSSVSEVLPGSASSSTVKQTTSSNPASTVPSPTTTVQTSSSVAEVPGTASSSTVKQSTSSSPVSAIPSLTTTTHSSTSISEVPASTLISSTSTSSSSTSSTSTSSTSTSSTSTSSASTSSTSTTSSTSLRLSTSSPTSTSTRDAGIKSIEIVSSTPTSTTDTDTRVITLTTTNPTLVTTAIQTQFETVDKFKATSTSSSSLSKSSAPIKDLQVSKDGRCSKEITCVNSTAGPCCSTGGYCGATKAHCVDDCFGAAGNCGEEFVVGDGGKSNDTSVSPTKKVDKRKVKGWHFSRRKRGKRNWDNVMAYGGGM